ncbi:MAG: DoxX subfamily, partial [candidate division KSB1 bacterium]|nr:DoxX subfamily [candidate division KSB1 bacterium]
MDDSMKPVQKLFLVLLRAAIGWHFLYEGLVKLFMGNWTSAEYLSVSSWIFAPIFRRMAATPSVLVVVDFLNIWGLILIG